jgi:hypothetical protein
VGRPPLPLGTYGKILFLAQPGGQVKARAKFRDFDGRVRLVSNGVPAPNASFRRSWERQSASRVGPGLEQRPKRSRCSVGLGREFCLKRSLAVTTRRRGERQIRYAAFHVVGDGPSGAPRS